MENEPRVMFLKGANVYLRPLSEEDVPFLLAHINDEETRQFLTVNHPVTLYQEKEWLKRQSEDKSQIVLGIVLIQTDQLIGTIGLHKIDSVNQTAEVGCAIHKEHVSKKYGSEAGELLIGYAFNTLNLRKLNARAFSCNERSVGLQLKGGFKKEGCLVKEVFRNGAYQDVLCFGLFREDFCK